MLGSYPGTPHHQALVERVVDYYTGDSRILAVCLFGSLARGNWDQYSDLDLDVVIADDVQISVLSELSKLCTAFQPLGEKAMIMLPNGSDSGDVVLESLTELSIRYHVLETTSPNIIDSLQLLVGRIDLAAIKAAGRANQNVPRVISGHDIDHLLRWAVEVNIRLHRRQFWLADHLLHRMRERLVEIFAYSHGSARAYHAFDAQAPETLKAHIGRTLPHNSLESIQDALSVMLELLKSDLDVLSNGQLQLTETQHEVIERIRERQVHQ